jgi:hypothetical protein
MDPMRTCANGVDTSRQKYSANNINALRDQPPADTSKPPQKSPNNAINEGLTADEVLARLKYVFRSDAREIAYGRLKVEHTTREAYGDLLSPPRAADDIKAIHEPHHGNFGPIRICHDDEWLLSAPAPIPTYVEGGLKKRGSRKKRGSGLHYKEGGWIWGGGRQALPDIEASEEPDVEAGFEETFLQAKCSHLCPLRRNQPG